MTEINRYSLILEALAELKPEIDSARRSQQPVPAQPPLSEVLAEFGPMPGEALFLGVASDGLPVLLNRLLSQCFGESRFTLSYRANNAIPLVLIEH